MRSSSPRNLSDDGSLALGKLTASIISRVVRHAIEQASWRVERVPGPNGGKREVIVARPVAIDGTLDRS